MHTNNASVSESSEIQNKEENDSDITVISSDEDKREASDFKEHRSTYVAESQSTLRISIISFDVSKMESIRKALKNSRIEKCKLQDSFGPQYLERSPIL